jgi:hypothetical protein
MSSRHGEPWIIEHGKTAEELFIATTERGGRGQRVARLWNVKRAGGIPDNEARDRNAARLIECVNLFAGSNDPTRAMELVRETLRIAMASDNEPLVRTARAAWKRLGETPPPLAPKEKRSPGAIAPGDPESVS